MQPPKTTHITTLNFSVAELVPYVHWEYFFYAWRLMGDFSGIENADEMWISRFSFSERTKAEEAQKLYADAMQMLQQMETQVQIRSIFRISPAISYNEGILFTEDKIYLPTLRQQQQNATNTYLSLCDFVDEKTDFVGIFASSVVPITNNFATDYEKLLFQTLCDRLAEAATEKMHLLVRTEYWGYAPNEKLSVKELHQCKYAGIRPAVGYPSLPDQSVIFILQNLIPFGEIGISLTENGAMNPASSTCGLMFANPKATYFSIGKIGDDQKADYERRKRRFVPMA